MQLKEKLTDMYDFVSWSAVLVDQASHTLQPPSWSQYLTKKKLTQTMYASKAWQSLALGQGEDKWFLSYKAKLHCQLAGMSEKQKLIHL